MFWQTGLSFRNVKSIYQKLIHKTDFRSTDAKDQGRQKRLISLIDCNTSGSVNMERYVTNRWKELLLYSRNGSRSSVKTRRQERLCGSVTVTRVIPDFEITSSCNSCGTGHMEPLTNI